LPIAKCKFSIKSQSNSQNKPQTNAQTNRIKWTTFSISLPRDLIRWGKTGKWENCIGGDEQMSSSRSIVTWIFQAWSMRRALGSLDFASELNSEKPHT